MRGGNVENEPVFFGGGATGGYGGYGDSGLGILGLLALLGNRGGFGNGNDSQALQLAELLSDIKGEVNESEAEIKESILQKTIGDQGEFRSLHNRMCDSEKESIKAGYEARIQTAELGTTLSNKIDREIDQVKSKLNNFEVNVDKQFCSLSHDLERSFHRIEERELREENRELRDRLFRDSQNSQTALLLQAISNLNTAITGNIPNPLKQS